MKQQLIFTNNVAEALDQLVATLNAPQIVVVVDTNTERLVLPRLVEKSTVIASAQKICIKADDENKTLEALTTVWQQLADVEATRSTLMVNIGGGMVSDLAGFAAATYKRGIRCINIPTTVLAAVDASVGGKTGINFNGYKNQLGTFTEPVAAIISSSFFDTLPDEQILSGYGEMLKHGLLENADVLAKLLAFTPLDGDFDAARMLPLVEASVKVKARVVETDFTETGLRKALNFGHTIGHAFESFALKAGNPIAHGYAVAWGCVAELVISHMQQDFPSDILHKVAAYVRQNYGSFHITCDDYPALIAAMRQDKKNRTAGDINFTLLRTVGEPIINCTAASDQICAALDIYRDLMGE